MKRLLSIASIWLITICAGAQPAQGEFVKVMPTSEETDAYYIGKYAVTNAEWKTFVDATGIAAPKYWPDGEIPEGRSNHPVLWVSAEEAEAYCSWLGQSDKEWRYALPTEAEWEFAAVGTTGYAYPWGNSAEATYSGMCLLRDSTTTG